MKYRLLRLVSAFAVFVALQLTLAAQEPAPGFRLYSPLNSPDTVLVDINNNVVHTWPGAGIRGIGIYLENDGTLTRGVHAANRPVQPGGANGGIQRMAFDGTLLWEYKHASTEGWSHHDLEVLPNGNVMFQAWDFLTREEALAAGRNPALLTAPNFWPDAIFEVKQTGPTTGEVVWEWHMMDHIVQDFDVSKPNFGSPGTHPELLNINYPPDVLTSATNGEWNHTNSINYDPIKDIVILSSPFQNEFWFIDHSTTTAEAAGHTGGKYGKGGDFLYRWGNPVAYGRGQLADQKLFFHHSAKVIPEGLPGAGNILIFNNRAGPNFSSVVEVEIPDNFDLAPGAAYGPSDFSWEFKTAEPAEFNSRIVSSAERLANGNTLICSGFQGWIFEITSAGEKVWEHFSSPAVPGGPRDLVFQAKYVDRSLWTDTKELTMAEGGTATFELLAGSPHAGNLYVLLGSISGNSPGIRLNGHVLPLNLDLYFFLMLTHLNQFPFAGTLGVLDEKGRASASVTLPGGITPLDVWGRRCLHFNHAFGVLDLSTGKVVHTSNPVPP